MRRESIELWLALVRDAGDGVRSVTPDEVRIEHERHFDGPCWWASMYLSELKSAGHLTMTLGDALRYSLSDAGHDVLEGTSR